MFQIVKVGNFHKLKANNALSSSGILQYQKSAFSVEITVNDGEFTDKMDIQIYVADINESPQFPDDVTFTEFENCCSTSILCPSSPTANDRTFGSNDFTASDPEGQTSVLTYSVTDATDGTTAYTMEAIRTSGNTHTLRSSACIDYEGVVSDGNGEKVITVSLSVADDMYTRTCVCDTSKAWCSTRLQYCTTTSPSATGVVKLLVRDVNEAFTISSTLTESIPEGSSQGTQVLAASTGNNGGVPYNIFDPDAGQTYKYTFGSATSTNAQDLFALNTDTGKITTKVKTCAPGSQQWPCLDFYNDATARANTAKWTQTYVIHIDVTDSVAPKTTSSTAVTVSITNTNEVPLVIQPADNHMDHTHPFALDEDSTTWTQQMEAFDPDLMGTTEVTGTAGGVPDGRYQVITTTPGSWNLKRGFDYIDEAPGSVAVVQFELSSSTNGLMQLASTKVLDFEKSQTYNVEITYTDTGTLESETRVINIQLYDCNEAPTLSQKVVMTANEKSNWFSISQHVTIGSNPAIPAADCTCVGDDCNPSKCYTGQCVTSGSVVVEGQFCNSNSDCASGNTCAPKNVKNNAVVASDVDVDTTLTYSVVSVEQSADVSAAVGPYTWTTPTTNILTVDSSSGSVQTAMVASGPGTELLNLNEGYKITLQVGDGGSGGDATYKSKTANTWDAKVSANVAVYFKTVETNAFPNFVPASPLSLSIREDAIDGHEITTFISATDNNGDTISWDLLTLPPDGQKMIPRMPDNANTGNVNPLRGDKFVLKQATGASNNIQLVGDGVDFERAGEAWPDANRFVFMKTEISDGKGGTRRLDLHINIEDVNETPVWPNTAYSIQIPESAPVTTTTWPGSTLPGTDNLATFQATDVDVGDTQTYSIYSTIGCNTTRPNLFAIDSSRVITLSESLNYETCSEFSITVRVTDLGDASGSRLGSVLFVDKDVLVSILDDNEAPVLIDDTKTVFENETTCVFQLTEFTSDPDKLGRKSFSWTENSEAPSGLDIFLIDGNRMKLRDGRNLDFENAEQHTMVVTVKDGWQDIRNAASSTDQGQMVASADLIDQGTFVVNVKDVYDIGTPVLERSDYQFLTDGNEEVILNANNLGPTDFKCTSFGQTPCVTYEVFYGPPLDASGNTVETLQYTATSCERVSGKDNTQIKCLTQSGFGVGHVWQIAVTFDGSTTVSPRSGTSTSSYMAPTLSVVSAVTKGMTTAGGVTFSLTGKNFGPVGTIVDVFYASDIGSSKYMKYIGLGCVVVTQSTTIECSTSPGVGTQLKYCLNVGTQWSEEWCNTWTPGALPPQNVLHSIQGGSGTTLVTINSQSITQTAGVEVTQGSKTGLLKTTLNGVTTTVEITVSTDVVFDTLAPLQIGDATFGVTIDASNVLDIDNGAISYYGYPIITSMDGTAYDTDVGQLRGRGGDPFDISGSNFGPIGTVVELFYGPKITDERRYIAVECLVTAKHTKMKCTSPSGVGKGHISWVRAGGQFASAIFETALITYRAPTILSVGGAGAVASTTEGNSQIILTGTDFGPSFTTFSQPCSFEPVSTNQAEATYVAADMVAHYGVSPNATAVEGVVYQSQCCVVESDERVVCRTAPGTGTRHKWVLRIGKQWSTIAGTPQEAFEGTSYGRPIIYDYRVLETESTPLTAQGYNTTGGESIVIVGKNFGYLLSKVQGVSYGMLSNQEFVLDTSTCDFKTTHTELRCPMAAGAGFDMSWQVIVDGQASVYPTSAYGQPTISGFSVDGSSVLQSSTSQLNTHGGQTVIIFGQNFGPVSTFITEVTYGPYGKNYRARNCSISVPSVAIMCLTAPGVGQNHRWTVSIRGQTNQHKTTDPLTSYALPKILEIVPNFGSTKGGTEITVVGMHFGAVDVDSVPGVAVYMSGFSSQMLGCKEFEVRRGRDNPAKANPLTMMNNETISFILPEYHTAGHEIKVAVGAEGCPVGTCPNCPSLLRAESNPTVDKSTFSYLPPKISLIQIQSFKNAKTTADTNGNNRTDKMLILEGENFCRDDEVCGSVWIGNLMDDSGRARVLVKNATSSRSLLRNGKETLIKVECPQYSGEGAPVCQYTHSKIVLVTNLAEGTVWITAGMKAVNGIIPQETNTVDRPPKQFEFVSPDISAQNKTDLAALTFDTKGGCEVFIYGRYFGQPEVESQLCVTVGKCIPRPEICGDPCFDRQSGAIVGRSVPATKGSLRWFPGEFGQFSFKVRGGNYVRGDAVILTLLSHELTLLVVIFSLPSILLHRYLQDKGVSTISFCGVKTKRASTISSLVPSCVNLR